MLKPILADISVSIAVLKANPLAVIRAAHGLPIVVFDRNAPVAYLVPANTWEALIDRFDDIELAEIVRARAGEDGIPVDIATL